MYLTPHFTLGEFVRSDLATRRSIDNAPPAEVRANLKRVAETLEQVRALIGRPLVITSGYRCLALNKALGSSSDKSAHMLGLAADFVPSHMTPLKACRVIRDSKIEFDQLIYEGTWVHVGLSIGAPRREVLTAVFKNGCVSYTKGLPL